MAPAGPPGGQGGGLPADWDPSSDLLVVCGSWRGARVSGLAADARAIAYLPPGADEPAPPAPFRAARSAGDLFLRVLELEGRSPRRVRILSTEDPWADDARRGEAASMVEQAVASKELQRRTLAKSGPLWLEQSLENLVAIAERPSIHALAGAFAGLPAVLVSPGPSLARNVERLAALRGRALIVSGTHALSVLRRHGVRPDLVVASDAGDLLRHWEGTPPEAVGALALGVSCRPDLFALATPRQFVFSSNHDVEGWILEALGEPGHLPTGGSVACSAVSLALHLGCDPIALVGQDLSFPGGRYYAEGGLDGEAELVRNPDGTFFLRKPAGAAGPGDPLPEGALRFTRDQRLFEVPAYGGQGSVLTSEVLRSFLVWFEALASTLAEGREGARLWNCTEGGARIRGTRELPLVRAASGWTRAFDPDERFERARAGTALGERRARLASRVGALLDDLDPCVDAARRCLALCRDRHRIGRLADAETELKRRLAPLRLLSVYAQHEIAAARQAAAAARTIEENLAAAGRLFEIVLRSAERLRAPLRSAHSELVRTT